MIDEMNEKIEETKTSIDETIKFNEEMTIKIEQMVEKLRSEKAQQKVNALQL